MPSGGQNKKPTLAVVREGNPGHRPLRDAVTLPPSALSEPDWSGLFPDEDDVAGEASKMWRKLAPTLVRSVGLVGEQQVSLEEYCTSVARVRQNERALSLEGMLIRGAQGGWVKNPRTTILNQYRGTLRSLTAELGLSPAAAARLTRPEGSDGEEDIFDN